MSIFGKIKDAIFGKAGGPFGDHYLGHSNGRGSEAKAAPQAPAAPAQAPAQTPAQTPAMPQMQQPAQPAAPAQPVDVAQVLEGIAAQKGHPNLDWRHSIVDLMKLLDLDSSLDNRKELATELGYTGAKDGSAEMNLWLHRQVMTELEKNGGKVPADLKA